ncbi:hypothetical protein MY4038_006643 [Beauveria bassiana]
MRMMRAFSCFEGFHHRKYTPPNEVGRKYANFPLPTPTTTTSASFVEPFAVRPSPTGGMGAFATRALLPNEVAVRPSPTGGMGAFATRALLPNEVAVRPSPTGGMGAFATRALLPNEVILEEKPLFTSTRGDSIFKAFTRASREKQKEAIKLHIYEPANNVHYTRGKTPDLLYRWYRFRCGCGACEGVSEQEMDSSEARW